MFLVIKVVKMRVEEVFKLVVIILFLVSFVDLLMVVILVFRLILVFKCCNLFVCMKWFLKSVSLIMFVFKYCVVNVMNCVCMFVGKFGYFFVVILKVWCFLVG